MSEYEFNKEENEKIDRFIKGMLGTSIVLTIAGILTIIDALLGGINIPSLLTGFGWTIFGIAFYFPTDNFKKIIETKGNDISELMTAFEELKVGWSIVVGILIFQLIALLLDIFAVI